MSTPDGHLFGAGKAVTVWSAIIQTVILLGALLSAWRGLELKISAIDAHLLTTASRLEHHIKEDHEMKDRSRLQLHNSCAKAMTPGCHDQGIRPYYQGNENSKR